MQYLPSLVNASVFQLHGISKSSPGIHIAIEHGVASPQQRISGVCELIRRTAESNDPPGLYMLSASS
jgi:hypothetical protein